MYVDKKIALQNLANSEALFNKMKTGFLKQFQNAVEKINELYQNKDYDAMHQYIHSIKGMSLNVGSQNLYDDADLVLEKINKEALDLPCLEQFIFTFRSVYEELSRI